jgi:hypothetical protein
MTPSNPWNLPPLGSRTLTICCHRPFCCTGNKMAFGKTGYSSDSYKVIKCNLDDLLGADICRQYGELLAWQRLGHISCFGRISLNYLIRHFDSLPFVFNDAVSRSDCIALNIWWGQVRYVTQTKQRRTCQDQLSYTPFYSTELISCSNLIFNIQF